MICFPNAKINLGLHIVRKRQDGYHDLETVFYPIPVKDALEVTPTDAEAFSFTQSGIPVDGEPEKNLVVKAVHLLSDKFELPPLNIHLLKAIPFGAGLGGGSADAAFTLTLLNNYCNLQLTNEELEELAARLGADCPFFIRNTPVLATGTGNIFEPIDLSLTGYHLCLVKPDIFVSTPAAYSMITPSEPSVSLKEVIRQPIAEWRSSLANDFEQGIFSQHPRIAQIKQELYEAGAVYASMSGSGSSLFGIFKEATSLKAAFPNDYVWEGAL